MIAFFNSFYFTYMRNTLLDSGKVQSTRVDVCFYQGSIYYLTHVQKTIQRFLEIKAVV